MNRGEAPAQALMFSSSRTTAVAVCPDSDRVGGYADESGDVIFRRGTAVFWSDGEDGWDRAD
jgi:hypothetical protein